MTGHMCIIANEEQRSGCHLLLQILGGALQPEFCTGLLLCHLAQRVIQLDVNPLHSVEDSSSASLQTCSPSLSICIQAWSSKLHMAMVCAMVALPQIKYLCFTFRLQGLDASSLFVLCCTHRILHESLQFSPDWPSPRQLCQASIRQPQHDCAVR